MEFSITTFDEEVGQTDDLVIEGPEPGDELIIDKVDYYANLEKAKRIVTEIDQCRSVQQRLKDTFSRRGLDGGAMAAMDHPLYLEAQKRIDVLQEDFVVLI